MLHKIAEALIAYGPPGVFLLALLDSLGVPLPAAIDVLLLLVAWKTPDRAYLTAGLAIVGSLIGNIGLFWAARGGGKRWVKSIPEPEKPQRFRRWFRPLRIGYRFHSRYVSRYSTTAQGVRDLGGRAAYAGSANSSR